jgi:hypothetical protein
MPSRFVGYGDGSNQRKRSRAKTMNGDRVARLYRIRNLGGKMRRRLDFGAVAQDQPVDVAPWRHRELLNLTSLSGKLLRG